MEEGVESAVNERSFGHCIVTWEIKNFGLALWQKSLRVETPVFSIRAASQSTEWKLILVATSQEIEFGRSNPESYDSTEAEPSASYLENSKLVLNLQRCSTQTSELNKDHLTRTFWVDCRVDCTGVDGKIAFAGAREQYFDEGSEYSIYLGSIFDTEGEFHFLGGAMKMVCQIIVVAKDYRPSFDICDDIDLCALSEDLHWVFIQKKLCDQTLIVKNKMFDTHKALLAMRSNQCEAMLQKRPNLVTHIQFPDIDCDAMMSTLEYLYSGNMCDIMARPSVSLYRCIDFLNLFDLKKYYEAERVDIETEIDVRKLTYVWLIDKFSEMEGCVSSRIVCNSVADVAWQIHLHSKGLDGESDYAAISVEYIEGKLADNLNIQCAIVDDGNESRYWKTVIKSSEAQKKELQESTKTLFTDEKFMVRNALLNKTDEDGTLKLGLRVRMCSNEHHSSLRKTPPRYFAFGNEMSLTTLSQEMYYLRNSAKYSDLTIEVGNELFKAHKFIIYARSAYLSGLLDEVDDSLLLPYVSPRTMDIALDYMYSAKFYVSEIEDLLNVYKFASEYVVSRLREKCVQVLSRSFAVDTVCDILRVADDYKDSLLKDRAFEFVRLNIEDICKLEDWKELLTEKSALCEEAGITSQEIHGEVQEVTKDDIAERDFVEKLAEAHHSAEETIAKNESSPIILQNEKLETIAKNESCPIILHNEKLEVIARTPYVAEIKDKKEQCEPLHEGRIYLCLPTPKATTIQIQPEESGIGPESQTDDQSNGSDCETGDVKTVVKPKPKKKSRRFDLDMMNLATTIFESNLTFFPCSSLLAPENVIPEENSSSDSNIIPETLKCSLEKSSVEDEDCGVVDQDVSGIPDPTDEVKAKGDSCADSESEVKAREEDEGQSTSNLAETTSKVISEAYQKSSSSDLKTASQPPKCSVEVSSAGETPKDCEVADSSLRGTKVTKNEIKAQGDSISKSETEVKANEEYEAEKHQITSNLTETPSKASSELAQKNSDSEAFSKSSKESPLEDSSTGETPKDYGGVADRSPIGKTKDEMKAQGYSCDSSKTEDKKDEVEKKRSTSSNLPETTSKATPKDSRSPRKRAGMRTSARKTKSKDKI